MPGIGQVGSFGSRVTCIRSEKGLKTIRISDGHNRETPVRPSQKLRTVRGKRAAVVATMFAGRDNCALAGASLISYVQCSYMKCRPRISVRRWILSFCRIL